MKKGKAKSNSIDKELDLDSDLDLGGFDFDMEPPKDDRKPSTKIKDGIFSGAKEGLRNTAFLKKTLKEILPTGFGQTMDLSDKINDSARNIYSDSVNEIKPALKDFKKLATKLVPKDSTLVPKSVAAMLKRWEEEREESSIRSKESQREDFLNIQLADAFKEQFQQAAKDKADDTATDRINQGLALTRHKDLFGAINQSNQFLSSLDQYQTNITVKYQKKSLELQYRQLFATQDILEETRKALALQKTSFENLVKNTALPDFVKINSKEFREQVFKNKFYESIQRGLFGGQNEMIEKLFKNIKDKTKEKISDTVNQFKTGMSATEMGADGLQDAQSMGGPGGLEMGAGAVAGGVAQGIGGWAGKKFKEHVLSKHAGLNKIGTQLEGLNENLPRKLDTFKTSNKWEEDPDFNITDPKGAGKKVYNGIMRLFQSIVPGAGVDTSMERVTAKDLNSPYVITRRTDKSLNEIIPGYLSRILREIQVLRTGNEKIELTEYSYSSNKFTSKSKSLLEIKKKLLPANVTHTETSMGNILKEVDPNGKSFGKHTKDIQKKLLANTDKFNHLDIDKLIKEITDKKDISDEVKAKLKNKLLSANASTGGTQSALDALIKELGADSLSDDAKKELKKTLLTNSTSKKEATVKNLADASKYSDKNKDEISSHMKNFFDTANDEKKLAVSKRHNSLSENFGDPREKIQELISHGKESHVKKLGLLDANGNFDINNYLKLHLGEKVTALSDEECKRDLKKFDSKFALDAINKTPVTSWSYKPGMGDGKYHIGPMAQGVNKTMGDEAAPDGKKLDLVTMNGVAMAAIQGLTEQVKKISIPSVQSTLSNAKDSLLAKTPDIKNSLVAFKDDTKNLVHDIYIKGETHPRIIAAKLQMGLYKDRFTNLPIHSLDDIKGEIIDEFGNVVLERTDLIKAGYYNTQKKTFELVQKAVASKYTGQLVNGYIDTKNKLSNFNINDAIKNGVTDSKTTIGNIKDKVMDIYIEGSKLPALYATKLQEGKYKDKITNSPIYHQSQIVGEIIDEYGNVVISKIDLLRLKYFDLKALTFKKLQTINAGQIRGNIVDKALDIKSKIENFDIVSLLRAGADKVTTFAKTFLDKPKDVYIQGSGIPVMYATKIIAGEYRDKLSNDIICHQNDIKGEVIDSENTTVISIDDIPNLVVYYPETQRFGPIRALVRGIGRILKPFWDFQTKTAPKMVAFNYRVVKGVAKGIGTVVGRALGIVRSKVRDVFVGDEKEPRMYATRIKLGHYRDKVSGTVITHQEDIKGEVIDNEDQIVITEDDLDKLQVYNSLLRIYNPFKLVGWVAKKTGKALAAVQSKMYSLTKVLAKGVAKGIGTVTKAVWNYLSKPGDVYVAGIDRPTLYGNLMAAGEYISATTRKLITKISEIDGPVKHAITGETVLTEEQISKGLFNARGEPIKPTFLQNVGSALGKLNRLFSKKVALPGSRMPGTGKAINAKGKPTGAGLALKTDPAEKTVALLTDIKAIFKDNFGKKKKITGDIDGDGTRENSYADLMKKKGFLVGKDKKPSALPAAPTAAKAAAADSGIMGTVGTIASSLKGVGSLISGAAGLLGIGTAAATTGGVVAGGAAAAGTAAATGGALAAGTTAAGTAAATGGALAGGGALATIGTGLAALGGGIVSVLSSPVVLAAGAIALTGYGLYKGYKYATRNDLTPLGKIRYVQYGFDITKPEHANKTSQLEDYLKDFVRIKEGKASIEEKDLDAEKLLSPFGLDPKDNKDLALFFQWYQNRFKPVFLTHCTALNALTNLTDFEQADKLKPPEQKAYVEAITFSDGPYSYTQLPIKDPSYKASGGKEVQDIIKASIVELGLDKISATVKADGTKITAKPGTAVPSDNVIKTSTNIAGTTGALGGVKIQDMDVSSTSEVTPELLTGNDKAIALKAIRFRAYGLTELDPAKARSLVQTEKVVSRTIKYSDKNIATWDGNPIKVLDLLTGSFGVSQITGKEANDWVVWFTKRFLPVYLGYLTGFKIFTGKEYDPKAAAESLSLLKPNQQVDLAKIIAGLKGIWSELTSPWPGYKLNSDSSSVKDNITFLESVVKTAKLEEEKKTTVSTKDTKPTPVPTVAKVDNTLSSSTAKEIGKVSSPGIMNEGEVTSSSTSSTATKTSLPTGTVAMAGGDLLPGTDGFNSINLQKGATLNNVNPELLKLFYGMAEEYNKLTSKKLAVNDGYRSYAQQVAMKEKYPDKAATPGTSMHGFGLAIDADSKTLDEIEELGLMKKYGLTRPVGGEPWHIEPAAVQTDITRYKNNLADALTTIPKGAGHGGGGYGTLGNATKLHRNSDLAFKLLNDESTPNIDNKVASADMSPAWANKPIAQAPTPSTEAIKTASAAPKTDKSTGSTTVAYSTPTDGENKPAAVPTTGKSNIDNSTKIAKAEMPSDPTVKIPDPTGSGYEGMKGTITAAANMVGIDPKLAITTAAIESSFNPNAKAKGTSAGGLFQFTDNTWNETLSKHGKKYGLNASNCSKFDPKANAIMGAQYIKTSTASISGSVKRQIGPTESYLAHFLGPSGAATFLKELEANPDTLGAEVLPKAAAANIPIFYNKGSARTLQEIYTLLDNKVREKAKSFGIEMPPAVNFAPSGVTPKPRKDNLFTQENLDKFNEPSKAKKRPNLDFTPEKIDKYNEVTSKPVAPTRSVAPSIAEIGRSPIPDTYGFNPVKANTKEIPNQNLITSELFKPTESLLGQSLDVEKQMLDVLKNIFGIMSTNKPKATEAPSNQIQATPPYTAPRAAVPMRKSII